MVNFKDLEVFRCFICGKYKNAKDLHPITVRDQLFKKDVCEECLNKLLPEQVKAEEKNV
jgi:hypothetical protein